MPYFHTEFVSYTLKRNITVHAMIPGLIADEIIAGNRNHKPKAKYPVLYLLHGYWGDHRSWERWYTSVERYAEEYQIAIITFSTENNFYMDLTDLFGGSSKERIFPGDFYSFLEKELPQFIEGWFPVSNKSSERYIAGLSMGGYGALIHGLGNPGRYRAVGAFSPPTTLTGGMLPENPERRLLTKYEPVEVIKAQLKKGKVLPPLYFTYGTEDFLAPYQEKFAAELDELKLEHKTIAASGMRHEWPLWDKSLDEFLAWLPRDDFYSKSENNISASYYGRKRKV